MNKHGAVLGIVGDLQELIGLFILRRLASHRDVKILHPQLLHVGFFGRGIEATSPTTLKLTTVVMPCALSSANCVAVGWPPLQNSVLILRKFLNPPMPAAPSL